MFVGWQGLYSFVQMIDTEVSRQLPCTFLAEWQDWCSKASAFTGRPVFTSKLHLSPLTPSACHTKTNKHWTL